MPSCVDCSASTAAATLAVPLLQIRRGYRAQWNDLAFSVETDSSDWRLHVQDPAKNETLYTAYRGGMRAAKIAAAEFAIFEVLGPESRVSPDRLAGELKWQEYW